MSSLSLELCLCAIRALSLCILSTLVVVCIIASRPFLHRSFVKSTFTEVPGPPRPSFLKGNFDQLFDQQGWAFHRDIVRRYGGVVRIHGLCGDERLYVSDPKALHHMVIKDQSVFEETDFFIKSNLVCFGPGIVSVIGEQHRRQRKLMSPVFNIHHLRLLTPIFHRISHELTNALKCKFANHAPGTQLEIDMFYWLKRTALEIIGQGGLGYSFGPLDDISTNEYSESIKHFSPTIFRLSLLRHFLPLFSGLGPAWLRRLLVRSLPIRRVQQLRKIVSVMDETVRRIYVDKFERLCAGDVAVKQQVGEGRDIMSILLRENMKSRKEDKLGEQEILAQMSTFIFAAQDTTSASLARVLQTLAEYPAVQSQLRRELIEAYSLAGTDLEYDALQSLPFLDAVCRETLRLYPPIPMLHRRTTEDTILPLSAPIKFPDGQAPITGVPIRKNTNVIIAIDAANRRRSIFGLDAEEWKPERWLQREGTEGTDTEKEAENRLPGVYSNLMTFLGGGRSCIGFNFAILELKVILATLVPVFNFELPLEKELAWKFGGIVSPGVKDDPAPKLPLRLSLVVGSRA